MKNKNTENESDIIDLKTNEMNEGCISFYFSLLFSFSP